jgi:hypothetical protein
MARKKKETQPVGPPEGWLVSEEYQISPQVTLSKGDECRIKGEQGKYKFIRHVINTNLDSEWVDLWGGSHGHGQWRSVHTHMLKHIPEKRSRRKKEPQPQT